MDVCAVDKSYNKEIESLDDIRVWNKPIRIIVKGCVHEYKRNFETVYRVYECNVGSGNLPIYIITDSRTKLSQGVQDLYIEPIEDHEYLNRDPNISEIKAIQDIANALGIKRRHNINEENFRTIWTEIVKFHNERCPTFYKLTRAIPFEELKKIENIKDLILEALTMFGMTDPRLKEIFLILLIHLDKSIVKESYVAYNPHAIVVTNTKTGKSTFAEIVGFRVERATPAGLVGFSTADKIHEGLLHYEDRTVFVDEAELIERDKDVGTSLLSVMSKGMTNIARGQSVSCETWATICFLANPIDKGIESGTQKLLHPFYKFITSITDNPEALGSRIGVIEFGTDYSTLRMVEVDDQKHHKAKIFLKTIQKDVARMFSVIIKRNEVKEWADQDIEEYCKKIDSKIMSLEMDDTLYTQAVIKFLRGHKDAKRHIRGAAIRRAFLELFNKFWQIYCQVNGNIEQFEKSIPQELILKLLNKADKCLEWITESNLHSIERIIGLLKEEDEKKQNIISEYRQLCDYQKMFVKAICHYYLEYKPNNEFSFTLDGITKYIKTEKGYRPVRVRQLIEKQVTQKKLNISWLEYEVIDSSVIVFKVINTKAIEILSEYLFNTPHGEKSEQNVNNMLTYEQTVMNSNRKNNHVEDSSVKRSENVNGLSAMVYSSIGVSTQDRLQQVEKPSFTFSPQDTKNLSDSSNIEKEASNDISSFHKPFTKYHSDNDYTDFEDDDIDEPPCDTKIVCPKCGSDEVVSMSDYDYDNIEMNHIDYYCCSKCGHKFDR